MKKYFNALIAPKLIKTLDEILEVSRRGFSITITSPHPELRELALSLLKQKAGPTIQVSEMPLSQSGEKPLIIVSDHTSYSGEGLVHFPLQPPEYYLPSIASTISILLTQLDLEQYMDAFDAKRTALLRKILFSSGLSIAVDAVAQVAFLSGLLGKEEEADAYLESLFKTKSPRDASHLSPEYFFSQILDCSTHPHGYLKAALSYYVVKVRNIPPSQASRALNISRTTLLEHLRLAQRFDVAKLFGESSFLLQPTAQDHTPQPLVLH